MLMSRLDCAATEARGKSWLEGCHRPPGTRKILAGDPDIKSFACEDSDDDTTSDEDLEVHEYSPAVLKESQKLPCQDLDAEEVDNSSVVCDGDTDPLDLPLTQTLRNQILNFLNHCKEQDTDQDDG